MSSIKLVNLNKSFNNKTVLNNINLEVKEGEIISLLGPSGCGKSTTLKIIAGILDFDKGDILFNDNSIKNTTTKNRNVGIVFQEYLLFPHMTVYENIEFGLKMKKIKKSNRDKKVKELIELVKLKDYHNKYPSELSGGQKQRVAIARTLAVNPQVLLLDEPFSNLDINLRQEMREFVSTLQKELKVTTILVTHDKEEALMMSDKIAVMVNGQIKQFDTPSNLYEKPNSKEVANIFGERNYIKGKIYNQIFENEYIKLNLGINENIDLDNVELMISKENIEINNTNSNHSVLGKITKKIYLGESTIYEIQTMDTTLKASSNNNSYNIGEEIKISFNFTEVVYFD
ncbi:MAG: ABC transporter ATP-binding protein [Peptostreptococcaceae bacterium]|nr:ABC transporter ATP-binding protein [Peptostreptococcaceae bacterium]MBP3932179.1 ABC transporter ATP-binding protein [Peptostreptococcaceae bacterium]